MPAVSSCGGCSIVSVGAGADGDKVCKAGTAIAEASTLSRLDSPGSGERSIASKVVGTTSEWLVECASKATVDVGTDNGGSRTTSNVGNVGLVRIQAEVSKVGTRLVLEAWTVDGDGDEVVGSSIDCAIDSNNALVAASIVRLLSWLLERGESSVPEAFVRGKSSVPEALRRGELQRDAS
jgi:hypothetical protein